MERNDAILVQQNPILYRYPRSLRQVQTPEGTDVEDGDVADEEDLGDYERPQFGPNYFEVNGEYVEAHNYLGQQWLDQFVYPLYEVEAMEMPPHMTNPPHAYQLKGASQADFCCEGPFALFACGDGMGVGKTLLAILAMWLRKDEPGFSLVVTPKTLCRQWVEQIEQAWEEGHQLRAFLLEDSSLTAHQLHAGGYDVVVCSYEFLEASSRRMRDLPAKIMAFANSQDGQVEKPIRARSALHSSFWREMGLPIKRLVLDEAQVVKKARNKRHQALKLLYAKATILLSGTLPHNKWHDFSGLVDFARSHPFNDHHKFLHAFSSINYNGSIDVPDVPSLRLLQRFLQAFTIARPSSILRLTEVRRYKIMFDLSEGTAEQVEKLTSEYVRASQAARQRRTLRRGTTDGVDLAGFLSLAVKAQLTSIHPLLVETMGNVDGFVADDDDDPMAGYVPQDISASGELGREPWLELVGAREELCYESPRVIEFQRLMRQIEMKYPGEKIVVFSQYLKFLDILDEALRRTWQIESLRYDGTVQHSHRKRVENMFRDRNNKSPLLLTAGAGGVGLNITTASIVVQTEVWWNHNTEEQALSRVWRQGQEKTVKYFRLQGGNSMICGEMMAVQMKKQYVNRDLMGPLLRRHDEGPDIRPLLHFAGLAPVNFFGQDNGGGDGEGDGQEGAEQGAEGGGEGNGAIDGED